MFDTVRKHTKWLMVVLFLLIIPSFVFFGMGDYTQFNEGASKVATVDGKGITQTEWDNAHRQEIERLRASNPGLDLALLDSPEIKYATLERLVRERVLAAAAAGSHLTVGDARLAASLRDQPGIAQLRGADGRLDMEAYRTLLGQQGLTPESFEAGVRAELAQQQVLGGVADSAFATAAQADVSLNALLERREIRVAQFKASDFAAKVQPSDADLETYYKQHQASYQAPETARIEYLVLDLDSLRKTITVNEQELRTYYEQNSAALGTPEERRAAHILIAAPKDAPAADREKAKASATALLQEVRKAPASFADAARKSSQDSVSAASGGDLGFFQRDKGTDPAIAKAAFALAKVGEISDVVESEFGYHLVQLSEIKPSSVPSFEKVRPQLEEQVRAQEAQKRFGELAEEFRNTVYEQSDSLKPAADKLKLTIQTADQVSRTPAPGATGPLANGKFLSALFSSDAIERKRNTEAMETGPNQLVSGRVLQHTAARTLPLAEVKDKVRAAYVQERAAELARQEGQARVKAWSDKPAEATQLGAPVVVSRDVMQGQPPQVVDAVLRADATKLPAFVGVNLGAEGFAVVKVDKIVPRAAGAPDEMKQHRAQYDQMWALAEARSYLNLLMQRYKAKILVPEPQPTLNLGGPAAAPAEAASG